MTERQMAIVSNLIKYGILILFLVIFAVLIGQYIVLGNLRSKQNTQTQILTETQQDLQDKQDEKDSILNNYNQYVEDYAKENLNMAGENETVFVSE